MNRLTWTALVPLLLSMAMVFSTYSYGSQSGLEAFTVSLVLSAPLIFTFLLVSHFAEMALLTGMRYLEPLPFVCTYLRYCYMFGGMDSCSPM